jgi:hypothetical protein
MSPTAIVFAGPSVFGLAATSFDGLTLRPPASCGDLLAATRLGATIIGLIDGVFENAASVWHKEILFALSAGVQVFGSSSMGALRAAECAEFGMVGLGAVFRDYASGAREADADVAVVHGPAEWAFEPLTLPLVDAEATLRRALAESALQAWLCDRLVAAARTVHFSQRSWERVIANAKLDARDAAIATAAIESCAYSVKRADAELLLARVRSALSGLSGDPSLSGGLSTPRPFERTAFFTLLEQRVAAIAEPGTSIV